MAGFYAAIAELPLGNASAVWLSSPIVSMLLGVLIFGETCSGLALLLAVPGVLLVVQPEVPLFLPFPSLPLPSSSLPFPPQALFGGTAEADGIPTHANATSSADGATEEEAKNLMMAVMAGATLCKVVSSLVT